MKVIVKQNQSIQDIALMYTGESTNIVAILLANGKINQEVLVGEELTIPHDFVSQRFVDFYRSFGTVVGTSVSEAGTLEDLLLADDEDNFIIDNEEYFILTN
jgi:hypothetical protein